MKPNVWLEALEQRIVLSVSFPLDGNVIDVAMQYPGAAPNGADNTAAVQQAITDNVGKGKVLYFRDGVYHFSTALDYALAHAGENRLWLQGQSQDNTIFKWNDNLPLFQGPGNVVALDLYNGNNGNEFGNYIDDLTIDIGAGNPKAVGLQYQTNNFGSVKNVTIRSSDPAHRGATGLDIAFNEPGPMLLANVTIDGFDKGIIAAPQQYSAVFEGLTLRNQRVQGLEVYRLPLSIHNFTSVNTVPAVVLDSGYGWGNVVITDSNFSGGAPGTYAVINQNIAANQASAGLVLLRNLTTSGYTGALDDQSAGRQINSSFISEYTTQAPLSLEAIPPGHTLNLPIETTPPLPQDPPATWVSVASFGATGNDGFDDTAAIQAALDSGATTIYFPTGTYHVGKSLTVAGNVKRIEGLYSSIVVDAPLYGQNAAVFRFVAGNQPTVFLDHLNISSEGGGLWYSFAQDTLNTLVIEDVEASGYRNNIRGGKVFLEAISGTDWQFSGQHVFARQLNPEGNTPAAKIVNDGGDLWILGLKTEGNNTLIDTRNGGRTEVLGGLIYPVSTVEPATPAFINNESSLSFTLAESSYIANGTYNTWVRQTRAGVTSNMTRLNTPINGSRNGAANINLYAGSINDSTPPTAPTALSVTARTTSSISLSWSASTDSQTGVRGYQVYRGSTLLGVTQTPTFTDTNLPDGTSAIYSVVAENGAGLSSAGSGSLAASTVTDTTAPKLLAASATKYVGNKLVLTFSKPLNLIAATNPANFAVDRAITIVSATPSDDGTKVTLTTSAMTPGLPYSVAVATTVVDRATVPNSVPVGTSAGFTYINNGGGTGLVGNYFNNTTFTGPASTRLDSTINFDWGNGTPGVAGIGADNFSVRWAGQIEPRYTENYTFTMSGDDGFRLAINGVPLINRTSYSNAETTATISLTGGKRYDIEITMFEVTGGAGVKFSWQSLSQPRELVPAVQLFPLSNAVTIRTGIGQGADTGVNLIDQTTDQGNNTTVSVDNRLYSSYYSNAMYIRLDLSGLDLVNNTISDATFLSTLTGFGSGDGIRTLNLYGVPDALHLDNWVEKGAGHITWNTAPGNNGSSEYGDPTKSIFLGTIRIDNSGYRLSSQPDRLSLSSQALLDFLHSDTDGKVTFFLKRVQPDSGEGSVLGTKELSAESSPGLRLALSPKTVVTPATVVRRSLFYNNSSFDNGSSDPGVPDDSAVATDKQPLLPGQTASFANYTSYDKGINGLMIDVNALGNLQAIGAADFVFKVSLDGSTWTAAPAPASVTVRPGAGIGGSDRIEILFDDYAITNKWLQVTINSNANTGLATADMFYFGNLVGGTGQHNNIAIVNTTDIAIAKLANNTRATITSISDFNRSGLVNVTDVALAKLNNQHSIPLFTAPAAAPARPTASPASTVLHTASTAGGTVFSTQPISFSVKPKTPAHKRKPVFAIEVL